VRATEPGHPERVAVDGPDAAGKTTLADELAEALEPVGREVIRASIDGFHRPRDERYRRGADSPRGYYEDSFDFDALRRVLLDPLGPGGDRGYCSAVFDFRTDSPVEEPVRIASEDAVLVFDGVFLLRPELRNAWDLAIFVSVDPEESLRRALGRDIELFGSAEDAERRYRRRYLPGQQLYLEEAGPLDRASLVVANDDPAAPRLNAR
jgi:uridine kinase